MGGADGPGVQGDGMGEKVVHYTPTHTHVNDVWECIPQPTWQPPIDISNKRERQPKPNVQRRWGGELRLEKAIDKCGEQFRTIASNGGNPLWQQMVENHVYLHSSVCECPTCTNQGAFAVWSRLILPHTT